MHVFNFLFYSASSYQMTPPNSLPFIPPSNPSSPVQHAQSWLTANRFGQFLSIFANYTCQDLLRLSRRDLFDLCGAADGIRLYNTLRSRTVKIVYITMGAEKRKKFQLNILLVYLRTYSSICT